MGVDAWKVKEKKANMGKQFRTVCHFILATINNNDKSA